MFEGFPYTNFHELNLDWIIEIAKDFLDQYTHIQETITQGLDDLDSKEQQLEALLDAWYTEHSDDIAQQLADAIQDLNDWYASNIASFEEFSNSEIARVSESIPSDYTELSQSALRFNTISNAAAAFHYKLAEINYLAIAQVMAATGWTDLPTGFTAGTFINYKYSPDYFMQECIEYPSLTRYIRIANATTGTAATEWIKNANISDVNSIVDSITVHTVYPLNISDYSNVLANLNVPAMSPVVASHGWTDLPDGFTAGTVINYKYSPTNFIQTLIEYPSMKVYTRSTTYDNGAGTANTDWIPYAFNNDLTDIKNRALQYKFSIGSPTDYDNLLAKINTPVITAVLSTQGWLDIPENETAGIFINYMYSINYSVQEFVSLSLNQYKRIVDTSTGSAVIDWKPFATDSSVWYAIGDSTTSGSYSTDAGEGVVANNAPWAYPNRIRDVVKGTVVNLGVPGSKITQFNTQANNVTSRATLVTIMGGINDYFDENAIIGSITDTGITTIMGALKTCITTINSIAPNARIVLISPLNAKFGTAAENYALNHRMYNFNLSELSDAMKTVAEYYGIEFINATENAGINILNIGTVLKDNIHPTQQFYQTIAEFIKSKLY